jgi:hypothetical protein
MRSKLLQGAVLLLLAEVLLSLPSAAQDLATIIGTVSDASGAAVPKAKVTISNPDRGFIRNLIANDVGEYLAAKVPIGQYEITAEAPGFEKLIRTGITLEVGQTLRVNLQLSVGAVTQSVSVQGNVPKVETETAALSDVITGSQISNTMLNGRNFTNLALLVPGATPDNSYNPTAIGYGGSANIAFNGGRMDYTTWELDGASTSDDATNSGTSLTTWPSIDSLAEFRVMTSTYGAETGKNSTATVVVATKSGTRVFHGDAYEYLRNDSLDANDWFVNRTIAPPGGNAPKTPLKWNDFGYTLGGPFYIPGHYNTDKSKTFFFWSQNWRRYRQGTVISSLTPSVRQRQGDFSECDPHSANFNPVVASGCALPVVNGAASDVVPVDANAAAIIASYYPLPNNGVNGYVAAHSLPTNWREEQIRVDQNIKDRTAVFVRFTHDGWNTVQTPASWTGSQYDTVENVYNAPAVTGVIHLTRNFKPNLMNEFIMGYSRLIYQIKPAVGPSSPAQSFTKPASWTAKNIFAPNSSFTMLPWVTVCGGLPSCFNQASGYFSNGANPYRTADHNFSYKDNVAWVKGRHTFKFGFFLEKVRGGGQIGNVPWGNYSFLTSSSVTTGNALADMDLGRVASYTEGTATVDNGTPVGGLGRGYWRATDFEPYIGDDWKATRKLTINIGVRALYYVPLHDKTKPTYDINFLPTLYNPRVTALLTANGNVVTDPATGHIFDYTMFGNGLVECGVPPEPVGCLPRHWQASPRFGFAYDPTGRGKTVIRGGIGIYGGAGGSYNATIANLSEGTGYGQPPRILASTVFNVNGFQNIQPGPLGVLPTLSSIPSITSYPTSYQYSFGIQREFPHNNLLGIAYVGSQGRHLPRQRNFNQVPNGVSTQQVLVLSAPGGSLVPLSDPACDANGNCNVQDILVHNRYPNVFFVPYRTYGPVGYLEDTAVSAYNAFQVDFHHTVGHGLILQIAYTWSHTTDDSTSEFFLTGVDDSNLSRWRANSNINRTHILVLDYIYDLPFFRHASNSLVRQILGGWRITGITSFYTGEPLDFGCGVSGFSSGIGEGVRCNSVGSFKIRKGVTNDPQFGPTPTWFDPNTISQPTYAQLFSNGQPGMFGYLGRNPLTGPGRNNWDLALHKEFELPWVRAEHSTLQFRLETFNTFNHPQWKGVSAGCNGSPNADGTPAFGRPCGGTLYNLGNGEVNSAWPARVIQFGLKFAF